MQWGWFSARPLEINASATLKYGIRWSASIEVVATIIPVWSQQTIAEVLGSLLGFSFGLAADKEAKLVAKLLSEFGASLQQLPPEAKKNERVRG